MFRRTLGSTAAVALIVTAGVSFAAVEAPRAGCARLLTDIPGDARYTISTTGNVADPRNQSIDGLDIETVTLRDTATDIEGYLKIKTGSPSFAAYEMAYRYDVLFKNGDGTTFVVGAMLASPTVTSAPAGQRQTMAAGYSEYPKFWYQFAGSTLWNKISPEKIKAEVDTATGWIAVRVPKEEMAKGFVATTLGPGTRFTDITAETYAVIPGSGAAVNRIADTASSTDPVTNTYRVGDPYCFGPPPATLTIGAPTYRVQFGDGVAVSAKLLNEAGNPVAGKTVSFSIPGDTAKTAVTNASGVATATFVTSRPAATYPLTATFAGDTTDGKATATGSLIVSTEVTKLAPLKSTRTSSTGRSVTTALTDDDGKPVTGQRIDWYVNGKKVASSTTDGAGKVTYKGAKAGQTVQAKYAGTTGKYRSATGAPLKV